MTVLFAEEYEVVRSSPGKYIKGKYVKGPVTSIMLDIHWQPLSGKDLLNLTEAQRTKKSIMLYSEEEIVGLDEKQQIIADIVIIKGVNYQVQNVKHWDEDFCNHYEAIGVEVNQ